MATMFSFDNLEEVKDEVEKLRAECQVKTELSNSLRKSHIEQIAKIQQANLEIDKLAVELNAKSEEISEIRQMYEELQSSLQRKDLFVKQITSANEILRAEYGYKFLKLEEANSHLVLALDQASARIQDLEMKARASDEEVAGLKRLISVKSEKCLQVQKNESKELKERELYVCKLEEESRILRDQLKWKNEQFSHLEEAHEKLQTHFQMSKTEWQKEKSALVDEISSVQATFDAQVRVSQSLETQLGMCNQAFAHEQGRRKVLEIELSESRSRHDNVFSECQGADLKIEQLTMKTNKEIAELRYLLREKDILVNEMKYKTAQLEQENNHLLSPIEDLQKTRVSNSSTSRSTKKWRNKIHNLEQLHNKCAANMKEKEVDWNSQMEILKEDLKYCSTELNGKNRKIREILMELEDCYYLLEVKNEEILVLIMVLKSEFYVAYSNLFDAKEKLEISSKQIEDRNMLLEQQLEIKNTELLKVNNELRRHKEMLDDSNECQHCLKEQSAELESVHLEDRINCSDALELELSNKVFEVEIYKLELLMWKAEVENLKLKLDERQQENESLLVIGKYQISKNSKLHEQVCDLEALIVEKSEISEMLKQEKDNYVQIAEERNCSITSLQGELSQLKIVLAKKEAKHCDLLDTQKAREQEIVGLSANIEERDHNIHELKEQVETLDQKLRSFRISIAEKETILDESLKRARDQNMLLTVEKGKRISDLEKEVNDLCTKLEFQEQSLIQSKQEALNLEASLQAKNNEMENLKSQFEKERSSSESMLEDHKKASIDRNDLLLQLESICGRIGLLCKDDIKMMDALGKMVCLSEEVSEPALNQLASGGVNGTTKFSTPSKSAQVSVDGRTPLTELN